MLKPNRYRISSTVRLFFSPRARTLALCATILVCCASVIPQNHRSIGTDAIPKNILLRIVRAEDERRWDGDLRALLSDRSASVRSRAALAAGRIGDEGSVPALISMLQEDSDVSVRAMAAFALGEIESVLGTSALLAVVKDTRESVVKSRIVEALGKIAATLPKGEEARSRELGSAILDLLKFENQRRSAPDRLTILLGLTAAIRAKPANAGPVIAEFLTYSDPRIRSDAANTLARLRLKDGNDQLHKLLTSDPDPNVRANAARVLGATEDKASFDPLLDRALKDKDQRVRVTAIRGLAALKDQRATEAFRTWMRILLVVNASSPQGEGNQILEIAVMLGRLLQGTVDKESLAWLSRVRERFNNGAAEVEIAFIRISPADYLATLGTGEAAKRKVQESILLDWKVGSSLAQGLGEIAALPDSTKDKTALAAQAEGLSRAMLDYRNSGRTINTLVAVHSEYAIPDVLRAFAAFKPKDLSEVLRAHLKESDVIIRNTAADLLGELPPNEANTRALIDALAVALRDKDLNDAALSILDALAKQKNAKANEALKSALASSDHLIRRRAVTLLKANGAGDFRSHIGTVQTQNTMADYERALSRIGKQVIATVQTSKGAFTIQLLPDDAPLTVDNFIKLAKRGYFRGITVHRVVPNFVIQDGDPRGDGNGGPGYQIRCEINLAPYERGTVGMALSGKDTGGSQWFVTHGPQPHLDGGYTVFGNVIAGMDTIDKIVRGDVISSVAITERPRSLRRGRR